MAVPRRPKQNKNPPIFSQEFIIQNHADIISCILMVLVVALMFQTTSSLASMFITLNHNVTLTDEASTDSKVYYTYGAKDLLAVFFYMLICVVIHAVIQDYILDKLNRRMHLSKVKHSKFNESGQLLIFYAVSAVWGIEMMIRDDVLGNISNLWENYPHSAMPFVIKFYYIIQISYWLHSYPELYFQKVKKDEIWARIQYISIYLAFISASYLLNLTRLGLILLVLHYVVELIFHASRLLYFSEKTEFAKPGFLAWNILFVPVRLFTITLSVLTLWYGLPKTNSPSINFAEGNFNTQVVRINCMVAIFLLQAWIMWNFITFRLRRNQERAETEAATTKKLTLPKSPQKKKKAKATAVVRENEESKSEEGSGDEPTVPENGNLRMRPTKSR